MVKETVGNGLTNLGNFLLSGLESLFVPQGNNLFTDMLDTLNQNFSFFSTLTDLFTYFTEQNIDDDVPSFPFVYKGKELATIDFSPIADYVPFCRKIIGFFLIIYFSRWCIVNVPNIVMGHSISESDCNTQSVGRGLVR